MVAPATPGWLADALARTEEALLDSVATSDPFLTDVTSHLVRAGGKRVRPAFTIASAAAAAGTGGRRAGLGAVAISDDVVLGGVSVELVHLGSLYHDDVIDEAQTRRTVPSVNARWGNLTVILAGDFLLAKASEIAASLGTEVAGLLAATIGRLCEGEVAELRTAFDVGRTEDAYLASIRGKTAALFATACRIGGIVGGLSRPGIDALTRFGDSYGVAFQIVDDVLDVVADAAVLGKPSGHDLVEGVYTLPVLRALGSELGDELRVLLGGVLTDDERERARDLVRSNGAVAQAVGEARRWSAAAVDELAVFGATPAATWLAGAALGLFDRVPA